MTDDTYARVKHRPPKQFSITVALPMAVLDEMDRLAAEVGETRSLILRTLVREALEARAQKEAKP